MKKTIVFTIIFILVFSSFSFAGSIPSKVLEYSYYFLQSDGYWFASNSRFYAVEKSGKVQAETGSEIISVSSNGKYVYEGITSVVFTSRYVTWSNHNILYSNGNVFFSLPVWDTSLEGAKDTLLGTILKLLPIILGFVIFGIALRKGYKMLRTLLLGA